MQDETISANPLETKPTVTPDGTKPGIAITKLDVRPLVRENLDLVKWRNYTRNAEATVSRRALLYSLYHDVMLDGHVISVTGKRIDAITTAKWQFVDKDGKPVDEVNELLDSLGFADLLTEIINSRFWGYSMIDCNLFKDAEGRWQMVADQFDRRHMRPEIGVVTYQQTGDAGFSIREGIYANTVLEAGKVKDLGLLLSAAQYAILKRGGVGDWATFVEVFGQPIMDATWDGFDEDQRLKLLQAITEMGNNARIVRPAGTTLQFVPNQGTANGQLQDSFISFLNKEISKALLGSTETTESSGSSGYAQSKEHGEQDDKKNESDLDYVRRILNSRFIKVLKAFGLPYKGGKFVIPEQQARLTPKEKFDMYVAMQTQLGMPIDHDYIYELTGMPKPADYDKQMAEIQAAKERTQQNLERENADTPPNSKDKNAKSGGDKQGKTDKKGGAAGIGKRAKLALWALDFFALPRQD